MMCLCIETDVILVRSHVIFSCFFLIQYITKDNSTKYRLEVKLMTYGTGSWSNPFKDKSGAYLFIPDGNAKVILLPIIYKGAKFIVIILC